ncbi:hypothetical protein AU192_02765 [Mycobacterium lehmannii]|uniref:Uncharacterized protein n=1 Tax=Mycobacterium lehmannii TaxID=2048550 RepID=A0A124EPU4_9MYCO|nr:hypothetical protein [Mycobacterium lehmannii]KUI17795.1 hypothetical protein AU192_02765 [Mycobacterium lehmannii]
MSAPLEPIPLADQGPVVVAERGFEVLLIDRGRAPTEMTVLLLTMSALIFGGFGVVSIFYAFAYSMVWPSAAIGVTLLVIGLVAFRAMIRGGAALRHMRMTPLSAYPAVAVFDRRNQTYRDGTGEIVAPLNQVQFERRSRLLTSTLVAVTPSSTRVLMRGNVFSGGVGMLDRVLADAVHRA